MLCTPGLHKGNFRDIGVIESLICHFHALLQIRSSMLDSLAMGDINHGADGKRGVPLKISSSVAIAPCPLNIVTFKRICNSAEKSY